MKHLHVLSAILGTSLAMSYPHGVAAASPERASTKDEESNGEHGPEKKAGKARGRVVGETGEALSGARVSALREKTVTDTQGEFVLNNTLPVTGVVKFRVRAKGYREQVVPVDMAGGSPPHFVVHMKRTK